MRNSVRAGEVRTLDKKEQGFLFFLPLKVNGLCRIMALEGFNTMSVGTIKSELRDIANRIPASASYSDAMYQLYVRMKIAMGKKAADEGRVVPHDEVRRRFAR